MENGAEGFDEYGFSTKADKASHDAARVYAQKFQPKLERRLRRFETLRTKLACEGVWVALPTVQLKKLLRKGIPDKYRAEVWSSVLGSDRMQSQNPDTYAAHLREELSERIRDEIERDLHRTFSTHRKFHSQEGRDALRNVLRAYAVHNQRVRYCQGLNFLAAVFLLYMSEEHAFWALASAVERLGIEGYYTEGMQLLRVDTRVLMQYLRQKCPKVFKRFAEHRVEISCICHEWFITWFSTSLPIATVLRVWDSLLFEGSKVLFRVAIAVFRHSETEILKQRSFETLMENAKDWPRAQYEHNELMKIAYKKLVVRRREIAEWRDAARKVVEGEDAERQARAAHYRQSQTAKAEHAAAPSRQPPDVSRQSQPVSDCLDGERSTQGVADSLHEQSSIPRNTNGFGSQPALPKE